MYELWICVFFLCSLLTVNCSVWIDRELSKRATCEEQNVRIEREQTFTPCVFPPGERITVHLEHGTTEKQAVVYFLSDDNPEQIVFRLETTVDNNSIAFTVPHLSVVPGTWVRVHIQGKHTSESISGSFRIQTTALWAAVTIDGKFLGGITHETLFSPVITYELPDEALPAHMVSSPDGRMWAIGQKSAEKVDGNLATTDIPLILVSAIQPWNMWVVSNTGGLDSFGFLLSANSEPIVVWSLHDQGQWRLVHAKVSISGSTLFPIPIANMAPMDRPHRIRTSPSGIFIVPRSHLTNTENIQFLSLSPEMETSSFSCTQAFGEEIPLVPFDAVPGKVVENGLALFLSCISPVPENNTYRVFTRWIVWNGQFQEALSPPHELIVESFPGKWHLPVLDPEIQGPALLEPVVSDGIWTLFDRSQTNPILSLSVTQSQSWNALFLDTHTLLLYTPVHNTTSNGSLLVFQATHGWQSQLYFRNLRYMVPFVARQLLLANLDQLIQITLDELLAGMPGFPVFGSACNVVDAQPQY